MQILIQQQGGLVTPDLSDYIEARVHFSLARFNGDVRKVIVHLGDRRKPQCSIEIHTAWGKPVFIQESETDIHAAVARAIERAGRAVDRQSMASANGLGLHRERSPPLRRPRS